MRHFVYCAALAAAVFFLAGFVPKGGSQQIQVTTENGGGWKVQSKPDWITLTPAGGSGGKVTVEGVCTHICRHGGRKIFLMGTDDTQVIRIEAGEKIGSFKPECVNNVVRVTGTLVEDRIDEAYLAEWELRLKDQIARQHGEGEAGCSAEHQARGESVASSTEKRIADFRARIADRKAKEGKEYLSFYHVDGGSYEVLK